MSEGYKGAQTPSSAASEYDAMTFLVMQILSRANTSTLVQVKAVTNSGGVSAVGFVDVQPLVAQLDGYGNAVPHGVINDIPYFRIQGGTNAVIIDPEIGDIGMAVFADRDISSVKAKKGAANPGSGRRFDMADGVYFGGLLNGAPTQYMQFSTTGINITSPTKVTITAPETDIIGTLKNNGVNVGSTHVHGGVSPGGSNTSGPA
jgi:hypothetical protein